MPDLETAEFAAYLDAMRASPGLCDVAEIGGATCAALRRLDSRMFNRVLHLTSTDALGEIAAFYGETPWWVSDSHGLGEELGRDRADLEERPGLGRRSCGGRQDRRAHHRQTADVGHVGGVGAR